MPPRRFPPPWAVKELEESFVACRSVTEAPA
jgi:hypothetical protein